MRWSESDLRHGLYRSIHPPHHLNRPGITRRPRDLDLPGRAEFFYSLNAGWSPAAHNATLLLTGVATCPPSGAAVLLGLLAITEPQGDLPERIRWHHERQLVAPLFDLLNVIVVRHK